ncbi:uncharacterized protein LOC116297143 [Actinia tenebrosa]|uniref:Uncharacterized protein LOC116297143 n=1 Tax=Actinia tenebrosa TaxID=6105 RepID=A0A6P8I942_ACTTE|nr:uncharacterized protein LOC116297143 [Actinia tenebrosa]
MPWYRSLPLNCLCLLSTLVVALDGSKEYCMDWKPQCRDWKCKYGYTKRFCPKKCGLCTPRTPPLATHFSSTITSPTAHGSTTRTVTTPCTHSSTTPTTSTTTRISTMKLKTKEEPVTTRHNFQATENTVPKSPYTGQRLTDKSITTQKSDESPNGYASYSESGLNVAMVIGIAVGCLLVIAMVILLFIFKRRKKRRRASLLHEPETIITMQPFNYTHDKQRDSSKNDAAIIYKDLHGDKGTLSASQKQLKDDSLKDDEPFYHILEGNTQSEHLYACAYSNTHENKAFDFFESTVRSQSRPEEIQYEIASTSVHKNKATQDKNDRKDDYDKPYYHVLEKQNTKYREDRDDAPLPVYQPLIGAKKDVMENTADQCSWYQPLTGIRSKGTRMS